MNDHGLTQENLLATLPVALRQDPSAAALAQAIAQLLAQRLEEIGRLLLYPAIDQLDEGLLDILAQDFKVDWWDPDYSLEEKRRTLKDSWRVHRMLGTKAAVETAISAIYPDTKVQEWWEYDGQPYHFKLLIDSTFERIDRRNINECWHGWITTKTCAPTWTAWNTPLSPRGNAPPTASSRRRALQAN